MFNIHSKEQLKEEQKSCRRIGRRREIENQKNELEVGFNGNCDVKCYYNADAEG